MRVARVGDTFSGIVTLPNPKANSGFTPTHVVGTFITGYEDVRVGSGGLILITTTGSDRPTGRYTNPHTGEQVPAWVSVGLSSTTVGMGGSKAVVESDAVNSKYVGGLLVDKPSCDNVEVG